MLRCIAESCGTWYCVWFGLFSLWAADGRITIAIPNDSRWLSLLANIWSSWCWKKQSGTRTCKAKCWEMPRASFYKSFFGKCSLWHSGQVPAEAWHEVEFMHLSRPILKHLQGHWLHIVLTDAVQIAKGNKFGVVVHVEQQKLTKFRYILSTILVNNCQHLSTLSNSSFSWRSSHAFAGCSKHRQAALVTLVQGNGSSGFSLADSCQQSSTLHTSCDLLSIAQQCGE